ncbi:expressed unknown protein [Seminavis robusta]|uniref:Vacuolar sorting receptor thioredoxin-like domain-containing protein n=1 Tax=Seminavis robusta TaxID=568900 RepID=A0A9N8DJB9_9STRA|nr:expressed unknown protein [Seminavis robusta]|eukprot:Sro189_g081600.1 n/a (521) ;mRNA; f:77621-79290
MMMKSSILQAPFLLMMLAAAPVSGSTGSSSSNLRSSNHIIIPEQILPTTITNHNTTTMMTTDRQLAVSDLWVDYETWQTYTHFPKEMKEYLKKEFQLYMRGPAINVWTRIPEPSQMVWPLLKGITVRNHIENKILWSTPNLYIMDGVDAKCREQQPDGTTIPVDATICQEHCTHQGRYCAPLEPAELPPNLQRKGKELVKEALRRLCFDGYYHASDHKWFDYLQKFDEAQCYDAEDMTSCSLSVIEQVDHCDYNNFAACVGDETALNSDTINEKLEKQLSQAKKHGIQLSDLPVLTIGTKRYTGAYTAKDILLEYCSHFGDDNMKPASCDICSQCSDVRKCLWTLECDGKDFEYTQFLASHGDQQQQTTPAPTDSSPMVETPIPVATLPPGGIATTETSTTTDTTPNNNNIEATATNEFGKEELEEANGQEILTFFIGALVFSAVTALFFVYKDRRNRQLRILEQARQDAAIGFRDTEDGYMDFVPDNTVEMSPTHGNNQSLSSSIGSQPPPLAFSMKFD